MHCFCLCEGGNSCKELFQGMACNIRYLVGLLPLLRFLRFLRFPLRFLLAGAAPFLRWLDFSDNLNVIVGERSLCIHRGCERGCILGILERSMCACEFSQGCELEAGLRFSACPGGSGLSSLSFGLLNHIGSSCSGSSCDIFDIHCVHPFWFWSWGSRGGVDPEVPSRMRGRQLRGRHPPRGGGARRCTAFFKCTVTLQENDVSHIRGDFDQDRVLPCRSAEFQSIDGINGRLVVVIREIVKHILVKKLEVTAGQIISHLSMSEDPVNPSRVAAELAADDDITL